MAGFPTAVVLAGGLGTRLRPAVADRPKVLAEVCGRPFLFHLLDDLEAAGARMVVLCTSFMAEAVRTAVGERYGAMAVRYSVEPEPLGTGGALRLALDLVDTDPLLVANGDSLFRTDLGRFWSWHLARELQASLLLAQVDDASRFGRVECKELGRITRFAEKDGVASPGWINAGIYLLARSRISAIPSGQPVSLEHDIFPQWLPQGLHGLRAKGLFMDIGTPESYRQAESALRQGQPRRRHDHQPDSL
jgi:NDP-sugar pyrophosphorylase family protein